MTKETHSIRTIATGLGKVSVHRVTHLPQAWGTPIATYLLTDGKRWSVIDCGWPGEQGIQVWDHSLRALGLEWSGLEHILVTHGHVDHIGQAQAMSERGGLPVSIHPDSLAEVTFFNHLGVEADAALAKFLVRAGQRHSGSTEPPPNPFISYTENPLPMQVEALVPGTSIAIGDCVLDLLPTPGHSQGHICFVDEQRRFAFLGDMVLPDVVPSVVFMPNTTDNPLGEYLDSLDRLESCEIALFLPAHGEPISEPKRRIDEIRRYHLREQEWIRDKLASGAATVAALALGRFFHGRRFEDMSAIAQMVVLGEVMAHLQFLVAEGAASSRLLESGYVRFALA